MGSVGTAVVTKIVSPQITGVELPFPGMLIRHLTCSLSEKCKGASPSATPLLCGPRHWCHESLVDASANRAGTAASDNDRANVAVFMFTIILPGAGR